MIRRLLLPTISSAFLLLFGACGSNDGEVGRPGPRLEVQGCRLVAPASLETAPGQALGARGRVRVPGLTDRTPGIDPDPDLRAMVGWGPDGTFPDLPGTSGAWTWTPASPAADWNGEEAGEPEVDEYRAAATVPGPGTYDLAFAFSADGGKTWMPCDLDGTDREGNDYSPEAAGAMQVRSSSDPCHPDPCTVQPPDTCEGNVPLLYQGPGTCRVDGGSYVCDYPFEFGEACRGGTEDGWIVCHQGACKTSVPVDFCQHLGPSPVTFDGEPVEFRGLVQVAGITDRSPAVDEDPELLVRFGFGWPDTLPTETAGWTWSTPVEAVPDWTDEELDEELRGADVYRATFIWAERGEYATAWRVSADGGATWTACDLDGSGKEAEYQPNRAGVLVVP